MFMKFRSMVLVVLILGVLLGQVQVFGVSASDRRALMKQTLKIKKEQTTGVVEDEPEDEPAEEVVGTGEVEKTQPAEEPKVKPKTTVPAAKPMPKTTYPAPTVKPRQEVSVPVKTVKKEVPQFQAAVGDDELLRLIPEEALFCLRINNMDESLMVFDKYLTGISPVGLNGLLKAQLGKITGDAMLSDIDTEGNFVVFGIKPWTSGANEETSDDPIIGMIVATKGNQFTVKYQNSNIGSSNYGLLVPKSPFEHAGGMLQDKIGKSSIITKLNAEEYKRATTAPIWAFGNLDQVAKDFKNELNKSFAIDGGNRNNQDQEEKPMTAEEKKEALKKKREEKKRLIEAKRKGERVDEAEVAEGSQMDKINEQNMKAIKAYVDFAKSVVMDADYASVAIVPSETQLDIQCKYGAKANTQVAEMLTDESDRSELEYAGVLSGTDTFNIVSKVNKESLEELNAFFMDMLMGMSDPQSAKNVKSLMKQTMEASGDEVAFAFSLVDGKPPFRVVSIVEVNDSEAYRSAAKQMNSAMTSGNAGAQMPITVSYQDHFGEYSGVPIDRMLISFNMPEGSPESAAINQMYGEGMDYRIAYTDELDITIVGPYADEQVRNTIDRLRAKQVSGDMKTVMDTIPNARNSAFAGSFNFLRLLQGLSGAVKSFPMPGPQAMIVSALFDGLGQGEPVSCLAFAGNANNGTLELHVVLPKKHLAEIVPVINQIKLRQQHMMQQMNQPQGPQ